MSVFGSSGFGGGFAGPAAAQERRVQEARIVLRRILEFTRHSIDDVLNDPIAKSRVRYYYKLDRFVDRNLKARERDRAERSRIEDRVWIGRP